MLGKPKNKDNYICVDSDGCKILHELGFQPVYRFIGEIYFTKTDTILKVVEKCNLKIK